MSIEMISGRETQFVSTLGLREEELDCQDKAYELVITVRAQKPSPKDDQPLGREGAKDA